MKIFKKLRNTRNTAWDTTKLSEIKANIEDLADIADINKVSDIDINALRTQVKQIQDTIGSDPTLISNSVVNEILGLQTGLDNTNIELDMVSDVAYTTQANQNTLIDLIEQNATYELIGSNTGGTVTEGVWTPVTYTITKNTFPITVTGNEFDVTENIDNVNVVIDGQAVNTITAKAIQLRLTKYNTTTLLWEQYGNITTDYVQNENIVRFEKTLSLPIGKYRIEIQATVAAGTITFTSSQLRMVKLGAIEGIAVTSSDKVVDTHLEVGKENLGINDWMTTVDTELNKKVYTKIEKTTAEGRIYYDTSGHVVNMFIFNSTGLGYRTVLQSDGIKLQRTDDGGTTWNDSEGKEAAYGLTTKAYVDSKLSKLALELGISPQRIKELFPPSPNMEEEIK